MKYILAFITFFCSLLAQGQTNEATITLKSNINDWLTANGLHSTIHADDIFTDNEKRKIIIYFDQSVDSIPGIIWQKISGDFSNYGIQIEEYLFRGIQNLSGFQSEDQSIQIYQECDNGTPCFNLEIFFENDSIKTIGPTVRDFHEIELDNDKLKSGIRSIVEKSRDGNLLSKRELYDIIEDSVTRYFEKKHKGANVKKKKSYPSLILKVTELKGEVIDKAFFPPREILEIEIGVNVEDKNMTKVFCEVRGKYGSAILSPSEDGYISMYKGYKDLLIEYNQIFLEDFIYALF
ncbi:hypothetical protein [Ekhidna sp.]|uniref:hypothetical protein n=1 Tax=Ekhidna sp. TaxID=2608089 RepID=UPI003BA91B59